MFKLGFEKVAVTVGRAAQASAKVVYDSMKKMRSPRARKTLGVLKEFTNATPEELKALTRRELKKDRADTTTAWLRKNKPEDYKKMKRNIQFTNKLKRAGLLDAPVEIGLENGLGLKPYTKKPK